MRRLCLRTGLLAAVALLLTACSSYRADTARMCDAFDAYDASRGLGLGVEAGAHALELQLDALHAWERWSAEDPPTDLSSSARTTVQGLRDANVTQLLDDAGNTAETCRGLLGAL
jgi:hypothetical protein